MEKRISDGTEILIFNYIKEMGTFQDNYHFKRGIVEKSVEIENLSTQENPGTRYYYTVVGEDKKTYYGTYGSGSIGSSFFRTKEDYKTFLTYEIIRLQENQELLERQIASLQRTRAQMIKETASMVVPAHEVLK